MEPTSSYPFDSPQIEQAEQTRRFVWRVAALMLLGYTLITLAIWAPDPSQVSGRGWLDQIVNVVLVFGLIRGLDWAYSWTLLRVGLGVIATIAMVATGSLGPDSLVDVLLFGLIAVVLIGAPNRTRALGAGALFAAMLLVLVAYPLATGRDLLADPALAKVEAAYQLLEQGDPDAAAQAFTALIAEHHDRAEAHNGLAVVYHWEGRYDEALVELNRALDLEVEDSAIWANRAWTFFEMDRYAECLPDIDQAIALAPRYANHHDTRAQCLTALERYVDAYAAATQAIGLDDADPVYYVTRGWAALGLEQVDWARQNWQEAIDRLPAGDPAIAVIEEWIAELLLLPQ